VQIFTKIKSTAFKIGTSKINLPIYIFKFEVRPCFMGSFEALAIGPYREQTKIAKNAGSVQFTKWRKYEMKRYGLNLPKIQNTKWENPIYEMERSNLRNETFILLLKISKIRNGKIQITKWPKRQREITNLRNELNSHVVFKKYPTYKMTYILWVSENVQFTKWTKFTLWSAPKNPIYKIAAKALQFHGLNILWF